VAERERERAVRVVWAFVELSLETSCWDQIQNLDNVWCHRIMSGPARSLMGADFVCLTLSGGER
jgi:hypothetical protein